jgi:Zn-dependent peptidase ImmA (M78 family)
VSRRWLETALQATGLQPAVRYPRDLAADVAMHLPVSIEVLPKLSSRVVREWLRRRGIEHRVSDVDRPLHGCLVARSGYGIIFLDADDRESDRRFTLAHEIAHFLLDHLLPRLRALKLFGEHILPVLDGKRAPSQEEILSAVLERVQLGVQVHLMNRGAKGAICTWDVEESEQRADRLALELLAPGSTTIAELRQILGDAEIGGGQMSRGADYVAERFGLPNDVAAAYIQLLLGKRRKRPSLTEEIFGRE